ncbi:MAG TPA: polymer-forming cytoskeletal protein [Spirochaetales bacterium]|nr:polymer-forming cytoskeletal protein [Spirochaetales bacterium]
MSDFRSEYIDETEIDTVLSEDFFFEGEMTFEEPLLIKGKLKGDLRSSSILYIEESADMETRVEAERVILKGKVKGEILAKKKLEMFEKAIMEGNISTPDLVIQSGCRFSGCCKMPERAPLKGNEDEKS